MKKVKAAEPLDKKKHTTITRAKSAVLESVAATKVTKSNRQPKERQVTQKKGNARSQLRKHLSVAELDANTRKISIIENIAKTKQPKLNSAYLNSEERAQGEVLLVVLSRVGSVILSPFKVNTNHAHIASNLARFVGTTFVVLGAFFTLYNMNIFSYFLYGHIDSQTAQTSSTVCLPGMSCNEQNQTNTQQTNTNYEAPDISISLESSDNVLVGTVPIAVTVRGASRVDIIAYNIESMQSKVVGSLSKVSDILWKGYWNTPSFDDGLYHIKAIVVSNTVSYTKEDSVLYEIRNHPIVDTDDEQSTTSTPRDDDQNDVGIEVPETQQEVPSPLVSLNRDEPLSGVVTIRTLIPGASFVRHFIRKKDDATFAQLGSAHLHKASTGEWLYEFDTGRFESGVYDIRTQAVIGDTHTTATKYNVEILKKDSDPRTDTPTTTLDDNEVDTFDLDREIKLEITKQNPLSGGVDLYIQISEVSSVEVYLLPKGSLTKRYLGLATLQTEGIWKYRFETTVVPNGEYEIFTKALSPYGEILSDGSYIAVLNPIKTVEPSDETRTYIETLEHTSEESKVFMGFGSPDSLTKVASSSTDVDKDEDFGTMPHQENLKAFVSKIESTERDAVLDLLHSFNETLSLLMGDFGRALRSGDSSKARDILGKIEVLRDEVIRSMPIDAEERGPLDEIRNYIEFVIKDTRERIEKSEAFVKERVGDAVIKDSDKDGVSDYDEISLYKTDALNPDSDADGYIDGIEILNGFDPNNSAIEASVAYESPKETGTVRDDILAVSYVTTLVDESSSKKQIKAHIGGMALPNSFVTIHIFSTPIILTVKADENGNWNYIFDKELDTGEHEIYISMTDNAGKIVAKSKPLAFIKTAEAFSPIDAQGSIASTAPVEQELFSSRALLTVASISVVALGLVLILLGLHVRRKTPQQQFA